MLPFDNFSDNFSNMQKYVISLQKDIEKNLSRSFDKFNLVEHRYSKDNEGDSVFAKISINENGHVITKTCRKEPGKDWQTSIEEYNSGTHQLKETSDSFKESRPLEIFNYSSSR